MRQYQSETISELATALSKFQGELENALKRANNPFFKSKYADLAEVINTAKEPLAANGLSVVQFDDFLDCGKCLIITQLTHSSGQWIRGYTLVEPVREVLKITLESGGKATKIDYRDGNGEVILLPATPQAYGSAKTYARRYSYSGIIGLAQEDDDGNRASGKKCQETNSITTEQAVEIDLLIKETGTDKVKFCEYFSIQDIREIADYNYEPAKTMLEKKKKV